jgi:hypothetical protein
MNKKIDNIINHLEFLGYKIEKVTPEKEGGKELIMALHDQKNNLLFWEMLPNFVLFRISLSSTKTHIPEMDDFVNRANKILNISKIYTEIGKNEDNVTLVFEMIYIGDYSKEIFSQFLDHFTKDQESLAQIEGFGELFLK